MNTVRFRKFEVAKRMRIITRIALAIFILMILVFGCELYANVQTNDYYFRFQFENGRERIIWLYDFIVYNIKLLINKF